jgi:2-dehydro-3-deoxygluconokinase
MDTRTITRDPQRSLGLYVISLDGVERQFNYWRESSAARCLADDPATLADATKGRALIHVSGITLAVIGARGRSNLMDALGQARSAGTLVSFDPNVRNRLWPDRSELRLAMQAILELVDIALPSFDDEAELWGDADPDATLTRLERAGVTEIVVKNGARDVSFSAAGRRGLAPTPAVTNILDTTGAGDGFNAGYLAARLVGMNPLASCGVGQAVAGQVLAHHGALAPTDALATVRDSIDAYASRSPLGG